MMDKSSLSLSLPGSPHIDGALDLGVDGIIEPHGFGQDPDGLHQVGVFQIEVNGIDLLPFLRGRPGGGELFQAGRIALQASVSNIGFLFLSLGGFAFLTNLRSGVTGD